MCVSSDFLGSVRTGSEPESPGMQRERSSHGQEDEVGEKIYYRVCD